MNYSKFLKSLILCCFLFPVGCESRQGEASNSPGGEASRTGEPVDYSGMIEVPPGEFIYGATEEQFQVYLGGSVMNFPGMINTLRDSFQVPPQIVDLPAFRIDEFEVTNEAFAEFLADSGYTPGIQRDFLNHWNSTESYPEWAATLPVVWVSPLDAQAFCEWRGVRLPTDQEWEKAARGVEGGLFPWGDSVPSQEVANLGGERLEPVGNRPEDVSVFGVYDMGGNAAEVTSTEIDFSGKKMHTVRGGSFQGVTRDMLTFQRATGLGDRDRAENIGFRCAADSGGD